MRQSEPTQQRGMGGATQAEKSLFGEGGMHCSKNVAYIKKKNLLIRLRFRDKMTLCVGLQEYIIVYSGEFFNSAQ